MNRYELERDLDEWFDAIEPRRDFDHVLADVFAVTRRERQRPAPFARLAVGQWTSIPLVALHRGPSLALVMLALLLALLGIALAAGALRLPPPPLRDGAIAIERWAVPPGEWSPGGLAAAPRAVALLRADGTTSVVTPPDREEGCAIFSPDGSQLALLSAPRRVSDRSRARYVLAVAEARAGGTKATLAPGFRVPEWITPPSWAPDGTALVAVLQGADEPNARAGDLLIVPVDGTPPRTIVASTHVPPGTPPVPGLYDLQGAAWSPDGAWIAFRGEQWDGEGWSYLVAVVRPDGSGLQLLDTWRESSGEWGGVAWSPDSQWIAYHRRPDGNDGGGMDLYAARADGSAVRQLTATTANEWVAEWSPDGSRIAAVGLRGATGAAVHVIAFPSGAVTTIPLAAGVVGATWSATGDRLVVIDEQGQVWRVAPDGAQQPARVSTAAEPLCWGLAPALSWEEVTP
jgi:Tol biopolymer transport system component